MSFSFEIFERSFYLKTFVIDTNHNNEQMTKDTSNTSQKSQLSQYTKSCPTKSRESINRRRIRYKHEYQKFVNKLSSLWGPNRIIG